MPSFVGMKKPLLIAGLVALAAWAFTKVKSTIDQASKAINVEFRGIDVYFQRISLVSLPGVLKLSVSNPSAGIANVTRLMGNISANGVQVATFAASPFTVAAYGNTSVSVDFSMNISQLAGAVGKSFAQIAAGNLPQIVARGVVTVSGVDVPFEYKK